MVNKFGSLSLQGKSIGKLTFAGRNFAPILVFGT